MRKEAPVNVGKLLPDYTAQRKQKTAIFTLAAVRT
jgi:hypothetical protein